MDIKKNYSLLVICVAEGNVKKTSNSGIQPWWRSGLERVSNSSRHSLEGPKLESAWRYRFVTSS